MYFRKGPMKGFHFSRGLCQHFTHFPFLFVIIFLMIWGEEHFFQFLLFPPKLTSLCLLYLSCQRQIFTFCAVWVHLQSQCRNVCALLPSPLHPAPHFPRPPTLE